MAKEAKAESFEQLYAHLEACLAKLERGGLPLDEAIALYEEGMNLARRCQERLDDAEQKITKLKESFAPVRPGANGPAPDKLPKDYESVPEGDPPDEDDPFG